MNCVTKSLRAKSLSTTKLQKFLCFVKICTPSVVPSSESLRAALVGTVKLCTLILCVLVLSVLVTACVFDPKTNGACDVVADEIAAFVECMNSPGCMLDMQDFYKLNLNERYHKENCQ